MKIYLGLLLILPVLQIQSVFAEAQNHSELVYEPVFKSEVFVEQAGKENRDTIILIHGLGTLGGKEWKPIQKRLATDYHVVVIDLPGFARSDKNNLLYSPKNYSHFIKWVIEKYAHNTVILAGHSMGGAIALYTAASFPQLVQKLVLIDAAGILNRTALIKFMSRLEADSFPEILLKPFYFGINRASNALFNAADTESKPAELERVLTSADMRSSILDGDPLKISALALINANFSKLLGNVSMPTLIIWGEDDDVAPLRTGRMLSYRLKNAQLKIIKDTGHVTITQEPVLVTRHIKTFLQSDGVKPEWQQPENTVRTINCHKKKDLEYRGHFLSINIHRCKRIRLINVTTNHLSINRSRVIIENSRLQGKFKTLNIFKSNVTIEGGIISGDVAMKTVDSTMKLTGVHIQGNIAIASQESTLDIAGVVMEGTKAAIRTTGENTMQASVSQTKSPNGKNYLHGPVRLLPKKDF